MPDVQVRDATADDAELLVRFVHALAAFEREPDAVRATAADFRRDGFGTDPSFSALVAEVDGEPQGMALYFRNYSTWEARPGLYLEDLWVEPGARKLGVGRRLVAALAARALERGYARLDLSVLDWNPARAFYARLGMEHLESWCPYRLKGDALAALAREHA